MSKDQMNYGAMVEGALRSVVRQSLEYAAEHGLPGAHHFYISFRTGDAGVEVPAHLKARFPEEMTIVLQHQFWGLEVGEEGFAVTLSFNKMHERLEIPYSALTGFFDPSVQFGLQFQPLKGDLSGQAEVIQARPEQDSEDGYPAPEIPPADRPADAQDEPAAGRDRADKVVTLDQFRKK